jgi:hypothetical protein
VDFATATPAQIDTEILRTDTEVAELLAGIERAEKVLDRIAKVQGTYEADYKWNSPAMKAEAEATVAQNTKKINQMTGAAAPLRARYNTERWTRYYLVANTNGHVHTSTGCRTCFDTTQFAWLTEQSGMSHGDLTKLAGELSCAECFPNLPKEIMDRKTRIEDPAKRKTRLERETAKAERDAKKQAKALLPDGSDLRFTVNGHDERLKTEAAASQRLIRHLGEHKVYGYRLDITAVGIVLEALANKHQVGIEVEGPQVAAKLATWVKREEREAAKTRARLGL